MNHTSCRTKTERNAFYRVCASYFDAVRYLNGLLHFTIYHCFQFWLWERHWLWALIRWRDELPMSTPRVCRGLWISWDGYQALLKGAGENVQREKYFFCPSLELAVHCLNYRCSCTQSSLYKTVSSVQTVLCLYFCVPELASIFAKSYDILKMNGFAVLEHRVYNWNAQCKNDTRPIMWLGSPLMIPQKQKNW